MSKIQEKSIELRSSLAPHSEQSFKREYIAWCHSAARNVDEYERLLEWSKLHDLDMIMINVNLFVNIQFVTRNVEPRLNDVDFLQLLRYVYVNRVYYLIFHDGVYWEDNHQKDTLPTDDELRKFVKIYLPMLTGSTFDKIISWIKQGYDLANVKDCVVRYFDNKKIFNESEFYIENCTADDFFDMASHKNFSVLKAQHSFLKKIDPTIKRQILENTELYENVFSTVIHEYMSLDNGTASKLLDKIIKRSANYRDQASIFLMAVRQAMSGFDYDAEVANCKRDNGNLVNVIYEAEATFIYKINSFDGLRKYSAPNWCINNSIEKYHEYVDVSKGDQFYVILQRYTNDRQDFKIGVTVKKEGGKMVVKHSYNYADHAREQVAQIFIDKMQPEKWYKKLFK